MSNYFRVILRVPSALTFDALTPEQQAAIRSVFGQFVMPMTGTVEADGFKLVDAITADNFKPETMAGYGINWPILGIMDDEGTIIQPVIPATILKHLPPVEGVPATLVETSRWCGWPPMFGPERTEWENRPPVEEPV